MTRLASNFGSFRCAAAPNAVLLSSATPCQSQSLYLTSSQSFCISTSQSFLGHRARIGRQYYAARYKLITAQALPERGGRKRRDDASIPVTEELADTSTLSSQLAGLSGRRRRRRPAFDEEETPPPLPSQAVKDTEDSEANAELLSNSRTESIRVSQQPNAVGIRSNGAATETASVSDSGWWPNSASIGQGLESLTGLVSGPSLRDAELVQALLAVSWKMQVSDWWLIFNSGQVLNLLA